MVRGTAGLSTEDACGGKLSLDAGVRRFHIGNEFDPHFLRATAVCSKCVPEPGERIGPLGRMLPVAPWNRTVRAPRRAAAS
jgi:hypothetical protein